MWQVTLKLIFNISLGLIFYLVLISCSLVMMVCAAFIKAYAHAETHVWDVSKASFCDLSTPLYFHLQEEKKSLRNDAWLSLPTAIPATMRFRTAAGKSWPRISIPLVLCFVFCCKAYLITLSRK